MCACMYPCVLGMYVSVCVPNPHTPWQSIQKPLVVPLSSPHQRAFVCGACIGTAQVGVSLVSLFDPLFKRSRLHCFDVCLTWYLRYIKIWPQHLVPGTPPYPNWPVTCRVCFVKLPIALLNIWWSPPTYATVPILIWEHDVSVLLNIWW